MLAWTRGTQGMLNWLVDPISDLVDLQRTWEVLVLVTSQVMVTLLVTLPWMDCCIILSCWGQLDHSLIPCLMDPVGLNIVCQVRFPAFLSCRHTSEFSLPLNCFAHIRTTTYSASSTLAHLQEETWTHFFYKWPLTLDSTSHLRVTEPFLSWVKRLLNFRVEGRGIFGEFLLWREVRKRF